MQLVLDGKDLSYLCDPMFPLPSLPLPDGITGHRAPRKQYRLLNTKTGSQNPWYAAVKTVKSCHAKYLRRRTGSSVYGQACNRLGIIPLTFYGFVIAC